MYPHERSLVKRLANKRFALIGVNSDNDKRKLKSRMKKENITWRSFWNGPQGTGRAYFESLGSARVANDLLDRRPGDHSLQEHARSGNG